MNKQTPGNALSALLKKHNLNYNRLAKAIGLSSAMVRLIARDENPVSASVAYRLAKFFKTKPEYWLVLQMAFDNAAAASDKKLAKALKDIPTVDKATFERKPRTTKAGKKAKPAAAKKAGAKKTAGRKTTAKKAAAKKPAAKKPVRKTAAKKVAAKKPAAKKAAPKKAAAKKPVRKVAVKRTVAKRTVTRKVIVKKAAPVAAKPVIAPKPQPHVVEHQHHHLPPSPPPAQPAPTPAPVVHHETPINEPNI